MGIASEPHATCGGDKDADYDKVIARYKLEKLGDNNWSQNMRIVPVNFNTEHKAMLGHCKMIVETDG